jgi:PucR family transcriptional regulator, purine catabolism regulatory protein
MSLTLRAVLDLDVVRRAKPRVLVGEELLDRPVRWVHTSELVEAAALLKGGELLLTTGLGLAGRGPVAQRTYVEQLAARGAAALALELGWTFPSVPQALISAARACELPLIGLQEIVPFVEMTEEVQTRIVHEDAVELRARRRVDEAMEALLDTGGLWQLTDIVSTVTGRPAVMEAASGHVIAWAGVAAGHEPRAALLQAELRSVEIHVLGDAWGWLHVLGDSDAEPELVTVMLDRARQLASLVLQGTDRSQLAAPAQLRHDFLEGLVRHRGAGDDALRARAETLDLRVPHEGHLVGMAVAAVEEHERRVVRYAGQAVASANGGVAAEIDGGVVGVVALESGFPSAEAATELLSQLDRVIAQQAATAAPRLAVGSAVHDTAMLPRTVREARSALALAANLGLRERAINAAGVEADRVLAAVLDEPDVINLVEERLGPLLEHDQRARTELVRTLRVYLTHGSSKTATAATLGLGRQTIHQRLERIREIVGPLDQPEHHVAWLLALTAHDLRHKRRFDLDQTPLR